MAAKAKPTTGAGRLPLRRPTAASEGLINPWSAYEDGFLYRKCRQSLRLHRIPHNTLITIRQDANELLVKVIAAGTYGSGYSLGVKLSTPLDIILELSVDVPALTSGLNLWFIVELDLRDEETGEPLGFFVLFAVFNAYLGCGR